MTRQVNTIFCDDIRNEVGGKLSFIGVYSSRMYVPSFPVILPKLCVIMSVITPASTPFKMLTLRILKDDEMYAEGEIPENELTKSEAVMNENGEIDSNSRLFSYTAHFVFSPFQIEGPCVLRIRAITEDGELKGAGLRIDQAPQSEPSS